MVAHHPVESQRQEARMEGRMGIGSSLTLAAAIMLGLATGSPQPRAWTDGAGQLAALGQLERRAQPRALAAKLAAMRIAARPGSSAWRACGFGRAAAQGLARRWPSCLAERHRA
jgi:hypothetical protein